MDELTIGLIALCFAGLGAILASIFGVISAIKVYREKKSLRLAHEEALIEDRLVEAMTELFYAAPSTPPSYRHNVHCPSCGRFAKRVLDSNTITECKVHGVQVRWKDIPVDWAVQPIAEGVTLQTAPIPLIFQPLGVEVPTADILDMQPIDHRRLVQMIPEAA